MMTYHARGRAALCILAVAAVSVLGAEPRTRRSAGKATTRPAGVGFAVATYNINYGNVDLGVVVSTIHKAQADLACLQETNAASQRYLQRSLKREYPYVRYRNDNQAAGGFAFLSKVPLNDYQYVPAKYGWFGASLCRLKLGGRDVQVANVHLQAWVPRGGGSLMGLLGQVQATERVRMKEIAYLYGKLSKTMPVIVAGDFNAPPDFGSAKYLARRGYVDSLASAGKNSKNGKNGKKTRRPDTWHWFWRGVQWRFCLDYIFHTRHIKTDTCRVVVSKASDHYLVVSRFSWAPSGAMGQVPMKPPR